ncbi:hypothetical protein [Caulobacter sp. Root1455]|uniref:hypothetical protein n=1 Tax=Caulobacter sp. Root1455 TaxID=1736465 RepID=UPI0012E3DE04|nr:hypothetical protein [Caulobacter sp. Root1455]
MNRRRIAVGAAIVVLTTSGATLAQSVYYDRLAWSGATLITSPIMVTSPQQCVELEQRLQRKLANINTAHDLCLQAEGDAGTAVRNLETRSICTKAACQNLHDARDALPDQAAREGRICQERLAQYQAAQQRKTEADRGNRLSNDLARSQYDPCVTRWKQYEAACTGQWDSEQQQRTCTSELRSLRLQCKQ